MHRTGFKTMMAAAALVASGLLGGASVHAAAPAPAVSVAPAPAPVTSPGPQNSANVPGATNIAPTTASATPPAQPQSPLLAVDGAPGAIPKAGIGQPVDGLYGLQPQVTRNGEFAHWFHNVVLFPTITAISVLVLALLGWVVVRYRRAANPVPSKTSHNTTIEVLWTLLPVVALVLIAVPSIGLLQAQFRPAPSGAITLKAIGNQWYWTYQYPDHGGFEITANMLKERGEIAPGERARTDLDGPRLLAADNRIVLPVGVPIRLITTSNDVIHSWAVPAFWLKLDAIPGRLNETSFTIEKPGVYFGQCSELCGARHAFMPIAVEAVTPAVFAQWVRAKGGTMPAAGKASDKVIPQAESDAADATSNSGSTYPSGGQVMNGTEQAPVTSQRATGNGGGLGNQGL